MIFTAFARTLGQLGDGRFLGVVLRGLGLAVALLFAMTLGLARLVGWLVPDTWTLPWIGPVSGLDTLAGWGVVAVMIPASVFLMTPVASAFVGLFLDRVAVAVEARHYPTALGRAPEVGFWRGLWDALVFTGFVLAANLLFLLVAVFSGPFAPLVFWAGNGWLLAREFFQMAAMRHLPRDAARALWSRHMGTLWLAGVFMAIPLSLPLINLIVPVLAAAGFTHLFHLANARPPG